MHYITCIGIGLVSILGLGLGLVQIFRAAEARYRNPDGVKMKVQISNLVQIFYNDHGRMPHLSTYVVTLPKIEHILCLSGCSPIPVVTFR